MDRTMLGRSHSHPTGERCWYHFPGTSGPTSDGYSFVLGSDAADAITCGERVVRVGRNQPQRESTLTARLASVGH